MVAGRHDDPNEKLDDEVRKEICESHRFQSFAGERSENFVKWCVRLSLFIGMHGRH